MDLGRLRETPAGYELRYERRLTHPPTRVWAALTENEHLKAWFPAVIEGEWVVGAPLRFVFVGEHSETLPEDVEGWDDADSRGRVVEVDQPRRLAYTWNQDQLVFELTPDGEGCLLVFTTVLPGRDHLSRTAGTSAWTSWWRRWRAGRGPGSTPSAGSRCTRSTSGSPARTRPELA